MKQPHNFPTRQQNQYRANKQSNPITSHHPFITPSTFTHTFFIKTHTHPPPPPPIFLCHTTQPHHAMASPKSQPEPPPPPALLYYTPIPPPPLDHHHHPQNYIVLPLYFPSSSHRRRPNCRLITSLVLLFLAVSIYVLWPSNPVVKIVRLKLDHVRIHTFPRISLDISLALTVKVRNVDVYSMDYKSVHVAVGYRGKELGKVRSDHGHVRARGSSDVDAVLEFDGVEVLYDVVYLLEDLARGTVPFDTVTKVRGQLGLFYFQIPLKAKVSCEVYVNTANQTIIRQNCYPE